MNGWGERVCQGAGGWTGRVVRGRRAGGRAGGRAGARAGGKWWRGRQGLAARLGFERLLGGLQCRLDALLRLFLHAQRLLLRGAAGECGAAEGRIEAALRATKQAFEAQA